MMHGLGQEAALRRARLGAVVLAGVACAAWGTGVSAQVPARSEELMRQWDLNRDGKIDAGEAEVARTKMRRARSEAPKPESIDPVTGRPRAPAGAATAPAGGGRPGAAPSGTAGRGLPPTSMGGAPAAGSMPDDGGLILVPGTAEPTPSPGQMLAEPTPPVRREREALPGTRAPPVTTTIPSVPTPPSGLPGDPRARAGLPPTTPGRDPRSGDLSGRARILPDGSAAPVPPVAGRRPAGMSAPALPRPGVIAGGPRSPGGASQSLNAGRLPGGLPQTRGVAPGGTAQASPSVTGQPYATQPYGGAAGARGTPSRVQAPPGGTASGPGGIRVPTPSQQSPALSRPGMRPQGTQPSLPRTQQTTPAVPRPPRVGPEDYFGR